MSAAYYDITIDEGSTSKFNIKFLDKNKNSLNLLNPSILFFEEFKDRFSETSRIMVYVNMQVRHGVDSVIVPIKLSEELSYTGLVGSSDNENSPITIKLTNGGAKIVNGSEMLGTEPNIEIIIDSVITKSINYGNYLYDIQIIFSQDIELNPKALSFRVLQGRFVVTPSISR